MQSVKNFFFRIIRFSKTYLVLFKQILIIQVLKPSKTTKTAVILIAKKYSYLQMGLICLSSFLYFNRDFQIEIYCDEKISKILRIFLPLYRKYTVIVSSTIPNNSDPYIEQLKLFFNLNSLNTILFDADIRWKGRLVYEFKNPLAYNFESNDDAVSFWPILAAHLDLPCLNDYQVLTCCVTSWGNQSLKMSQSEINKYIKELDTFPWEKDRNFIEFKRLRGQFLMSYFFTLLSSKTDSIVEIEKSNGKILETSFFGATGYRYGT